MVLRLATAAAHAASKLPERVWVPNSGVVDSNSGEFIRLLVAVDLAMLNNPVELDLISCVEQAQSICALLSNRISCSAWENRFVMSLECRGDINLLLHPCVSPTKRHRLLLKRPRCVFPKKGFLLFLD